MIRAIIFSATLALLYCLWSDRPTPVVSTQVDYCVITYKAAVKDERGKWRLGWGQGYGPCYLQDEYREI